MRAWALALLGLFGMAAGAAELPRFAAVRASHSPSDVLLLDRQGRLLQRQRVVFQHRTGPWVPLDQISPALVQAVQDSEDQHFEQHRGVDWSALPAAAWAHLRGQARGGSTLTMQLAGLLDPALARGAGGRSLGQKWDQLWAAQALEQRWTKAQILEAYLNRVPWRGETIGVEAMARSLFGKAPLALDRRESALAAALLRQPNAAPAEVARRACHLLRQAAAPKPPQDPCFGLSSEAQTRLSRNDWPAEAGEAPHLLRWWRSRPLADQPRGRIWASSLDADLQALAQRGLNQRLRSLAHQQVRDGAVLVLDNASGEILAWVGASAHSASPAVDGVLARRSPGSTLKPLITAQALAERRITAASLLQDQPQQWAAGAGSYVPQNHDRSHHGWVSVRTALASSLNIPAVQLASQVGHASLTRQWAALGLPLRESADHLGHSLALGGGEVPLLALSNAYRALANGGQIRPPSPQRRPPAPGVPVLSPAAAFIVGDILADPLARAATFGSDSVLETPFWSAVKTGTSKDLRDNWAIGWTRQHTIGVWVGNHDGSPMRAVSGSVGAAPLWAELATELARAAAARGLPTGAPPAPAGLRPLQVRYSGREEPPRREWFLAGTEPPGGLLRRHREPTGGGHIQAPADGAVLAWDPDIPASHQRLHLRAATPGPWTWRLDGQAIGQGSRLWWRPPFGPQARTPVLSLHGADGRVVDQITLVLRPLPVQPASSP